MMTTMCDAAPAKELDEQDMRLQELESWMSEYNVPRVDDVLARVQSIDALVNLTDDELATMTHGWGWDNASQNRFLRGTKLERFKCDIEASLVAMMETIVDEEYGAATHGTSPATSAPPTGAASIRSPFLAPLLGMVKFVTEESTTTDDSMESAPPPVAPITTPPSPAPTNPHHPAETMESLRTIQRGTAPSQQKSNRNVLKSVPGTTRVRFPCPTDPRAHLTSKNGSKACEAYDAYSNLTTVGAIIASGNTSNLLYDLGNGWAELIDANGHVL